MQKHRDEDRGHATHNTRKSVALNSGLYERNPYEPRACGIFGDRPERSSSSCFVKQQKEGGDCDRAYHQGPDLPNLNTDQPDSEERSGSR